ncbi:MAG: class I SAM-dependent methyltransferase [Halanaerobiales bacterium]|nr:class I SAM-dependent methyltransferase [Halanaerobiales bacterium]
MDDNKKKEIEFFNEKTKDLDQSTSKRRIEVAKKFIKKYKVGKNHSILEVGTGTGILYSLLKEENISDYLGIDISLKMIEKFLEIHPETDLKRLDFEANLDLNKKFDFVIIFDTFPDLEKIDMVFKNAYKFLKVGGMFFIVNSKTRSELKKEHKENVQSKEDPIPTDEVLKLMSWTYGFEDITIDDQNYFIFKAKKKR